MSKLLTVEEWQSQFVNAFEYELKNNLVTLSLKDWEWQILIEALQNAGRAIRDTNERSGKP